MRRRRGGTPWTWWGGAALRTPRKAAASSVSPPDGRQAGLPPGGDAQLPWALREAAPDWLMGNPAMVNRHLEEAVAAGSRTKHPHRRVPSSCLWLRLPFGTRSPACRSTHAACAACTHAAGRACGLQACSPGRRDTTSDRSANARAAAFQAAEHTARRPIGPLAAPAASCPLLLYHPGVQAACTERLLHQARSPAHQRSSPLASRSVHKCPQQQLQRRRLARQCKLGASARHRERRLLPAASGGSAACA